MNWARSLVFLCLLYLAAVSSQGLLVGKAESSLTGFTYPNISLSYSDVLAHIDMSRISEHVGYFASLQSRVTGYLGCDLAALYITDVFSGMCEEFPESNLQVSVQEYELMVPVDKETSVTVIHPEKKDIEAHALWPNLIQTSPTSPEGVEGPLIYVEDGRLGEFDGKPVEGSIVLMDFVSGDNWINAAKLGAKAVIFIEPPDANYYESVKKFVMTPLHVPRLYVSSLDGEYLKGLTRSPTLPIVRVKSRMMYQTVTAKNVIAEIPGETNDTIVVGAHYDTWSVVPALAPGADDSTGVSVLLELARFFVSHKPRRTMMFVALSGYWEALAGSRAFTDQYFHSESVISGERKIMIFIGLDYSTDSDSLAFLVAGHAFKVGVDDSVLGKALHSELVTKYNSMRSLLTNIVTGAESQLSRDYEVDVAFRSDGWWASIPVPYMLDSEPTVASSGMGFTIRTDNCYRISWGSPLSTSETVSFENLAPQLEVTASVIFDLANIESLPLEWSTFQPRRLYSLHYITGFVTIEGIANVFNYTKGWYDPLPNAIIHMPLRAMTYPFAHVITSSNRDGEFTIQGIPTNTYRGYGFGQYSLRMGYLVEAYVISNVTGLIEYGPDMGIYGYGSINFFTRADSHPCKATTVSFRCSPIELYDIGYVEKMTGGLLYDPRFSDTILAQTSEELQIFDFRTYSAYISYSSLRFRQEPVAVILVPPNERFSFTYRLGISRDVGALLLNSTNVPEGEGILSLYGEKLVFNAFDYTNDLYRLTSSRYVLLSKSLLRDAITEAYLKKGDETLSRANALLQQKRYEEAYAEVLSALSWSISSYSTTFNLINGVAGSTIIFFAIMVPFTLLLERMIFTTIGSHRVISTVSVGLATIFAFYILHPGMRMLSNSMISLLGISFEIFFLMVLAFFGDKIVDSFRKYRVSLLGSHFDYSRRRISSTFQMCFRSSTQNMRRRKFRTALTITSLMIIVFSFTAMTSITITVVPRENIIYQEKACYDGFLIKRGKITTLDLLLSDKYLDQFLVNSTLGRSVVTKRAWYYPQTYQNRRVEANIKGPLGSYTVKSVLGLSPEEELLNTVFILEGRWFMEHDYYSCIIPQAASEKTGAKVNEIITWGGIRLRVVGIYDSSYLNGITDIDGRQMTPIRPEDLSSITHAQTARQETILYLPTAWENLIVIPYKLAIDLGAFVPNIAVKIEDPETIEAIGRDLALNFMVQVYASLNGTTRIYSRATLFPTMGLELVVVPLAIGLMSILMTMIGNVAERKSDIFIYSCVGISPSGISIIFFIEALIYAVISTLAGYLAGLGVNTLLISYELLPGFYPNFTTVSELLVIGFSLLVTLLSALYPSLLASRLATPSLKRKWTIPTSPVGSAWEVPFPFTLSDEGESNALLVYLAEYFESQTDESLGRFITKKADLSLSKKELKVDMNLLPADLQIFQNVSIRVERQKGRFNFNVLIERESGREADWVVLNRDFITRVREQFLMWTSLSSEAKKKYIDLASAIS